MRVLFLAPMKAPDHPVPSGDRTIARLFMTLLSRLGYRVELVSHLRTHAKAPDVAADAALEAAGAAETARILTEERARAGDPPAFVFCYHLYHKAPDVIGPALASALNLPYVVAEASRAPKHAAGPFARRYALAEAAIAAADLHFCATARDRVMLEAALRPEQALVDLKPFLDLELWPGAAHLAPRAVEGPLRLLTVAMMREGYKRVSYHLLADTLALVPDLDIHLDVIGDGPARHRIEAAFAPFGARVTLHGRRDGHADLSAAFHKADLFLWPAVDEPFGMVFLEAQAHGLPCLAGAGGGVADVIRHDETGWLVPPRDAPALAEALRNLAAEPERRARYGRAAHRFVHEERALPRAMAIVADALRQSGIALPERGAA